MALCDFPTGLKLRAGAAWSLRALTPYDPRLHANLWQLNRAPYPASQPVAVGGRLGKLYLGEEPPEPAGAPEAGAPPREPRAPTPPPEQRSPNLSGATESGVQRSFALVLNHASGPLETIGISTPPIAWPYVVVGAQLMTGGGVFTQCYWNILETDEGYNGLMPNLEGQRLIEPLVADDGTIGGFQNAHKHGMPFSLPFGDSTQTIASQLIGATGQGNGRRLTFAMFRDSGASSVNLALLITIRAVVSVRPVATTRILDRSPRPTEPQPTPAPRAAPAPQPRSAPAPRPPIPQSVAPPPSAGAYYYDPTRTAPVGSPNYPYEIVYVPGNVEPPPGYAYHSSAPMPNATRGTEPLATNVFAPYAIGRAPSAYANRQAQSRPTNRASHDQATLPPWMGER